MVGNINIGNLKLYSILKNIFTKKWYKTTNLLHHITEDSKRLIAHGSTCKWVVCISRDIVVAKVKSYCGEK
jgi:hypothetical protein